MEEQIKQIIKDAVREVLGEMDLNKSQVDGFPEIMNLEQASEFVHLSRDYIKNCKEDLQIPHRRKGRAYLFIKSELLEWVQGREEPEEQPKINITSTKNKGRITKIV